MLVRAVTMAWLAASRIRGMPLTWLARVLVCLALDSTNRKAMTMLSARACHTKDMTLIWYRAAPCLAQPHMPIRAHAMLQVAASHGQGMHLILWAPVAVSLALDCMALKAIISMSQVDV